LNIANIQTEIPHLYNGGSGGMAILLAYSLEKKRHSFLDLLM